MEKPLRADYEEFQMTHRSVSLSYDQKTLLNTEQVQTQQMHVF